MDGQLRGSREHRGQLWDILGDARLKASFCSVCCRWARQALKPMPTPLRLPSLESPEGLAQAGNFPSPGLFTPVLGSLRAPWSLKC